MAYNKGRFILSRFSKRIKRNLKTPMFCKLMTNKLPIFKIFVLKDIYIKSCRNFYTIFHLEHFFSENLAWKFSTFIYLVISVRLIIEGGFYCIDLVMYNRGRLIIDGVFYLKFYGIRTCTCAYGFCTMLTHFCGEKKRTLCLGKSSIKSTVYGT